jgi:hypothetical protein
MRCNLKKGIAEHIEYISTREMPPEAKLSGRPAGKDRPYSKPPSITL